jgi:hypothetical protein
MRITIDRIANGYVVVAGGAMPQYHLELSEALDAIRLRFPVQRSLSDPVNDPEPASTQLELEAYIAQSKKD